MARDTEVVIVCTNWYKAIAKEACEQICSKPGFKAAVFDVDDYMADPVQERSRRFFISLGDERENAFTKRLLPSMLEFLCEDDVCIVLNRNNAIFFADPEVGVRKALSGLDKDEGQPERERPRSLSEFAAQMRDTTSSVFTKLKAGIIKEKPEHPRRRNRGIKKPGIVERLKDGKTWRGVGKKVVALHVVSGLKAGRDSLAQLGRPESIGPVVHKFLQDGFEDWVNAEAEAE